MTRQARELSDSGFMHVIIRRMGRQLLFEDTLKMLNKKLQGHAN